MRGAIVFLTFALLVVGVFYLAKFGLPSKPKPQFWAVRTVDRPGEIGITIVNDNESQLFAVVDKTVPDWSKQYADLLNEAELTVQKLNNVNA